jgi:hypothetical protein
MRDITTPALRAAAAAAFLATAVVPPQTVLAEEKEPSPGVWFDTGLGYGHISTDDSAPVDSSGGGLSTDVQVGAHLGRRWVVGAALAVTLIHFDYESNDSYSKASGQVFGNLLCVAQFEPKSDHGWWLGVGAGTANFTNFRIRNNRGDAQTGSGAGSSARVGYDWHLRGRNHVQASLSYTWGDISLDAPFTGNFDYSMVAIEGHYTFR